MGVISTIEGKCRRCYACVRNCPVKAIKVEDGQAQVIADRCVACGICVEVCSQNAKQIESGLPETEKMLKSGEKVIAILDATFPAAFPEFAPGQLVSALKKLGFARVMEAAFGGALLIELEYKKYLNGEKPLPVITAECPAVVQYLEKYYPELLEFLAPVVSSMIATARWIKQSVDKMAKIVFIGPCVARKLEAQEPEVAGVVDEVLVYRELKALLSDKGINPQELPSTLVDNPDPGVARCFSITGGLLKSADRNIDILDNKILINKGKDNLSALVSDIKNGSLKPGFCELHFCGECLDSPQVENKLSLFKKREMVLQYLEENQKEEAEPLPQKFNLKRTFASKKLKLPLPSPEQIKEILQSTNKVKPEDELNCGACGYDTCREHAIAVFQGLAESEMCHHFLMDKVKEAQELLIQGEKMVSLGQLAAGVAHELNNPLAGSLIYIRLLLKKLDADKVEKVEFNKFLNEIEKEINRCSRIIKNLLDFSRQTPPSFTTLNLSEILEKALSLAQHQAQLGNIQVIKEFDLKLPAVLADPSQMEQVFLNLILNAIHAMLAGGQLTLKTFYDTQTHEVAVRVMDTGCGISEENLKNLFTPFFTTKQTKGVGLGLAVAKGIVDSHRGRIQIESKLEKGTSFTIRLGVAELEKTNYFSG